MGDAVLNATFEILTRFDGLQARTDRPDRGPRAGHRNAARTLLMPAMTGGFGGRVSALEDRVATPERRSGCRSSAERMPCAASEIDRKRGTRQSHTTQLS